MKVNIAWYAARYGKADIIKILLMQQNKELFKDCYDSHHYIIGTPFVIASYYRNINVLNAFYNFGLEHVDIAFALYYDQLPNDVIDRVIKSFPEKVNEEHQGFMLNNIKRYTPLYVAIVRCNYYAVKALLENGASVNNAPYYYYNHDTFDSYAQESTIHVAVKAGDDSITRLLLAYGANVTTSDIPHGNYLIDYMKGTIRFELMLCQLLQNSQLNEEETAATLALFNVLFLEADPAILMAHHHVFETTNRVKSSLQFIYSGVKTRIAELKKTRNENVAAGLTPMPISNSHASMLVSFSSIFTTPQRVASLLQNAPSVPYDSPHVETLAQQAARAALPGI